MFFSTLRPAVTPWVLIALSLLVSSRSQAANSAQADHDWQTVLQLANGPGLRYANQEEAVKAATQHLDRQEATLRAFQGQYPDDSRHYSAVIRLAAVLAAKGRLHHDPKLLGDASKLLSDLQSSLDTPALIKADAAFAAVSQAMQDVAGHLDDKARTTLLENIRQFDTAYPGDRRTGNLFTEIATLYNDQPEQKKSLLEEALTKTKDDLIRHRIEDDLKRIALLGHPLDIVLQPVSGKASFDLAQRRGRVQVVLFWASYSLPALQELADLQRVAARFEGQPVDFVTVSVDEDRSALENTIKIANLTWPTHFDGRGWQGELVRSLGINALPTVWVLDRQGRLLTLNARDNPAATIQSALAQP